MSLVKTSSISLLNILTQRLFQYAVLLWAVVSIIGSQYLVQILIKVMAKKAEVKLYSHLGTILVIL